MEFANIIEPLKLEDFFSNHWNKSPLHISSRVDFNSILSFKDVNEYFNRDTLSYPFLRMIKDGGELPLEQYSFGKNNTFNILDMNRVLQFFEEGSSMAIQGAQFQFPNISKLNTELVNLFKGSVNSNIYITPASSQGFYPHFDPHEVIVFQICGKKTWRIYEKECDFPLKDWRLSKEKQGVYRNSKPNHEVELAPGDFLYLPSGIVHDAFCTDGFSIHITFGIRQITPIDVLTRLIEKVKENPIFRKPFEHGAEEELFLEIKDSIKNIINSAASSKASHTSPKDLFSKYCLIDSFEILNDNNLIIISDNIATLSYPEISVFNAIKKNVIVSLYLNSINKETVRSTLKLLLRKKMIDIID